MTGKLNPPKPIDPNTPLDNLGLPHVDVVLTERFLLPPEGLKKIGEPLPKTLGDISAMSGMPLEEVWAVICECHELNQNLYIQVSDLMEESKIDGVILVDMRPGVDLTSEPLHPRARLFHLENPKTFLPFLRSHEKVYVLSFAVDHAWSAAVSLKKMGIRAFLPATSK